METRPSLAGRRIAARATLAFRLVIAGVAAVSLSCLAALVDIHDRLRTVTEDEAKERSILRVSSAVRDEYAHVAHTIIRGNDSHSALFHAASRELEARAAVAATEPGLTDASSRVNEILGHGREIARLFDAEVLPAVRASRGDQLEPVHDRILSLALAAEREAAEITGRAEASLATLNRHVRATQRKALLLTVVAHVVALSIALVVAASFHRSIARAGAILSQASARIAAGDLDVEVPSGQSGELGGLTSRFNQMSRSLKQHHARCLQTAKLAGLQRVSTGIAHELNGPITVILGHVREFRQAEGEEDLRLMAIAQEAERCRRLVDGLLELSREGGIQSAPVAMRDLTDDVVSRLKLVTGLPSAEVRVSGDAAVIGDAAKLRQVLTNLIRNAIESAGSAGSVDVEIDDRDPGAVAVRVRDSGAGIPAIDQARLFDPFFTTKSVGTGLGLAVSRAIARAHGGDVDLVSGQAGQTTFRRRLPPRLRLVS